MPALDYQCELLVVSSAAGQNHYKLFSIQINMDIIFFCSSTWLIHFTNMQIQ